MIWFNPPYSKNVVTKVGHYFLKLLDKHFPRHHKLHKIFNRNTVKVSYSCTKNIKSIINSHNKKVLHQTETVKLKILYTKTPSHAMNKATARTSI